MSTSTNTLADRVYIVTGGGGGIGSAIAMRLAGLGAQVTIMGRSLDKLKSAAAQIEQNGGRAYVHPADVRDPEQVDAMVAATVERFGRLDGLVNNAAGNFVCPAEELSANGWRSVIDIVLNGTWNCTSAVGRHLIEAQHPGVVLNVIASYAWTGHPGTVHSAAAKAGVLTMARTLAVEWAQHGIRLNCIAPGPTLTDGAGQALWATEDERERVLDSVPMHRFAKTDEVAGIAAFLMSDDASYVTGEVLTADGGQSLGKQVYGQPVVKAHRISV